MCISKLFMTSSTVFTCLDCVIEPRNNLTRGLNLCEETKLMSKNRMFELYMQEDGNLVLYDISQNSKAVWATGTNNKEISPEGLQFKEDGDLVMLNPKGNSLIWNIPKQSTADTLVLENNGKLVLYAYSGKVLWMTNGGK